MRLQLSVNNQSVDSSGITSDYREAINEFIWNGFEANATRIEIESTPNEAYGLNQLIIRDNGDGINYDELDETFGAFLSSRKRLLSLKAKSKVNKGKGRFSFVAFAGNAVWKTAYKNGNEYKGFTISMSADSKDAVECTEPVTLEKMATGTEVVFSNITSLNVENMSFDVMEASLLKEFAWFLYLYKGRHLEIIFNGEKLDYSKYVNTEMSEKAYKSIDGYSFTISLVVWQESIKEKYCCYYFDTKNVLKGRNYTTFNRNTINFNHSVYVSSNFFDQSDRIPEDCDDPQISLFVQEEDKKTLKKLNKEIQALIEKRMSVYLSEKADGIVDEMISDRKTFPQFPDDVYGRMRREDLTRVTKEIYKLEPMIFYKLKPIQEKSLLGFLNLLLSSEEREQVLTIIEQVVELTPEQRSEFSKMLKRTSLENILDTIKFLEERFRVIEILRSLVFDMTEFSNERDHIQKLVEQHFWLFGEQYNLASADQRMKKALEGYINILYGQNDLDAQLEPDAENERRMDIFLCNKRNVESAVGIFEEENIIVELKAPKVPLSKKVYRQIEDYMDYIHRQPAFNSSMRRWKFIAVCKEIDDEIKDKYKAFESHGKVGLVYKVDRYEIYALTWDDVIKGFEMRYSSLLEKLKYDREQMANEIIGEVDAVEGREKATALVNKALS